MYKVMENEILTKFIRIVINKKQSSCQSATAGVP